MQHYNHEGQGLRVVWDKENRLYSACGWMRDFMAYMRHAVDESPEPWKRAIGNAKAFARATDPDGYHGKIASFYEGSHSDWYWTNGDSTMVCETIEDVEEIAHKGWPDGVAKVAKLASEVRNDVPEAQEIKPHYVWQDEGDEFDIHRMWNGEVDSMWYGREDSTVKGPRVIKLIAPIGGSATKNASELFWCGATALVLCDVLERAGYRVAIDGLSIAEHDNFHSLAQIRLKEADQYVSLANLAVGLCLPAYFRTVGIHWRGTAPMSVGSGFGMSRYCEKNKVAKAHAERLGILDGKAILLGEARNKKQAVSKIRTAIQQVEEMI